jgi:ECF sigma factor
MLPELLAFLPSFQGRQAIPVGPLATDNLFGFDHKETIPPRIGPTQAVKQLSKTGSASPSGREALRKPSRDRHRRSFAVGSTLSELVKLRFYMGMSVAETAQARGVSEKTVTRQWAHARAWFLGEITRLLSGEG